MQRQSTLLVQRALGQVLARHLPDGFTAVKHQREVGTGYFDAVTTTIEREASTAALHGSTENEQFF